MSKSERVNRSVCPISSLAYPFLFGLFPCLCLHFCPSALALSFATYLPKPNGIACLLRPRRMHDRDHVSPAHSFTCFVAWSAPPPPSSPFPPCPSSFPLRLPNKREGRKVVIVMHHPPRPLACLRPAWPGHINPTQPPTFNSTPLLPSLLGSTGRGVSLLLNSPTSLSPSPSSLVFVRLRPSPLSPSLLLGRLRTAGLGLLETSCADALLDGLGGAGG